MTVIRGCGVAVVAAALALAPAPAGADIMDDIVNLPAKLQAAKQAVDKICDAADTVAAAGGLATGSQPGVFGHMTQLAYLESLKAAMAAEVAAARATMNREIAELQTISTQLAGAQAALKVVASEYGPKIKQVEAEATALQQSASAARDAIDGAIGALQAEIAERRAQLAAEEKKPFLERNLSGRIERLQKEIADRERQIAAKRGERVALASTLAAQQRELTARKAELRAEEAAKAAPYFEVLNRFTAARGESPEQAIAKAPRRIAKRQDNLLAIELAGRQAASCLQARIAALTKGDKSSNVKAAEEAAGGFQGGTPTSDSKGSQGGTDQAGYAGPGSAGGSQGSSGGGQVFHGPPPGPRRTDHRQLIDELKAQDEGKTDDGSGGSGGKKG